MSYSARYVKPEELRSVWDKVRPALLEVKEASQEPWIPEDVYADCYAGRSMLFVLGDVDGFGVVQPQGDTLHVWCGWGAWLMDSGMQELFAIAKQGGARKITFDSNRPGWQRVATKYGFKPRKWIAEV